MKIHGGLKRGVTKSKWHLEAQPEEEVGMFFMRDERGKERDLQGEGSS